MNYLINQLLMLWTTIEVLLTFNFDLIPQNLHKSMEVMNNRRNETSLGLSIAKLKPPSNSYISDALSKWKYSHIDNDHVQLENATILVLCRNRELDEILSSMRSLEDRFNKDYHYPWTFLNDVEFTEEFKEWTTAMASGPTEYGLVKPEDWNTPDFIDKERYRQCIKKAKEDNVIYGGSKSYRNMCHFNSGFFFRQELVMKYDYYFRVEPGVEYYCDFQMDPFRLMREGNKKYGFVVTLYEYPNTIPTLFENVEEFMQLHPEHVHMNSAVDFLTTKEHIGENYVLIDEPGAEVYNMCHFWSNFEIGDLNFFRSKAYLDYFNFLSEKGGFYYERWGDAPVHSIGASILLDKDEIFHFEDIGYYHLPFRTYPSSRSILKNKRCVIPKGEEDNPSYDMNLSANGCLSRWWKYGSGKRFIKEYFHEEDYIEE